MTDYIEITHLLNSALQIKIGKKIVLVDALINDNPDINWFEIMPRHIESEILSCSGQFAETAALLFTHTHTDHFSMPKVRQFISNNPEILVVLPGEDETEKLLNEMPTANVRIMNLKQGGFACFKFAGIEIMYFKTTHLDVGLKYNCQQHYSFLLKGTNTNILITGDADISDESLIYFTQGLKISAAFFNPVVLGVNKTRMQLSLIDPSIAYIYHLPGEDNDKFGYLKMAKGNYEAYKQILPPCWLLTDKMLKLPILLL